MLFGLRRGKMRFKKSRKDRPGLDYNLTFTAEEVLDRVLTLSAEKARRPWCEIALGLIRDREEEDPARGGECVSKNVEVCRTNAGRKFRWKERVIDVDSVYKLLAVGEAPRAL